jgi:Flp pilus assembly pilin Flp
MLARLHRDEQGAEKVEYLLILAAVALPLLGIIIIYRDKLADWISSVWDTAQGKADAGSGALN